MRAWLWTLSAYALVNCFLPAPLFRVPSYDWPDRRFAVGDQYRTSLAGALSSNEVVVCRAKETAFPWEDNPGRIVMETVRLWGVDAEGTPRPSRAQARRFLEELVEQRRGAVTVRVRRVDRPPAGRGISATDRAIYAAEVAFADGTDVATELVSRGLSRWDRREAPDASRLRRAEESARAARRGLWAVSRPGT